MSNSSWRPDEDLTTIHEEDAWLQGALIMCIAYGSVVTLTVQCFIMLVRGFTLKPPKLYRDGPLLLYVMLIFVLNTIYVGVAMYGTQLSFVDERNFPGGPAAAEEELPFNPTLDSLGNNCFVISTFLSDALLLWRCTVLYKNCGLPDWLTIVIATAVWLAEFILGVFYIIQNDSPTPLFSFNFALDLWCFSLALNIVATFGIVARILLHRWRIAGTLGKEHTSHYTGAIAMVVESELLYTIVLMLFVVPYVRGSTFLVVFLQSLSVFQAVAALMIVYRVAQGQAWSKDTYAHMTASANHGTVHTVGSMTFAAAAVESGSNHATKDF